MNGRRGRLASTAEWRVVGERSNSVIVEFLLPISSPVSIDNTLPLKSMAKDLASGLMTALTSHGLPVSRTVVENLYVTVVPRLGSGIALTGAVSVFWGSGVKPSILDVEEIIG